VQASPDEILLSSGAVMCSASEPISSSRRQTGKSTSARRIGSATFGQTKIKERTEKRSYDLDPPWLGQ